MLSARFLRGPILPATIAAAVLAGAVQSYAGIQSQLTLTSQGTTMGFSLTTFATDFPTVLNGMTNQPDPAGIGVLGVAVDGDGHVFAADYATGGMYVFPNRADGQSATGNLKNTYGAFNAAGLTQLNGRIYVTTNGASQVWDIHPDGGYTYPTGNIWPGWPNPSGIIANPQNGHLYFSLGFGAPVTMGGPSIPPQIEEIDPIQAEMANVFFPGTAQFISSPSNAIPDSLALSEDGTVLYSVWSDGVIRGYSTALNASNGHDLVWSMLGTGSLAIGKGDFAGKLFESTNGEVDMIDIATMTKTVIANLGTYSGYLAADPFDGSLYITNSDRIFRLTAPAGAGFYAAPAPPIAVPEPAALTLLSLGGISMLAFRGKRKAK